MKYKYDGGRRSDSVYDHIVENLMDVRRPGQCIIIQGMKGGTGNPRYIYDDFSSIWYCLIESPSSIRFFDARVIDVTLLIRRQAALREVVQTYPLREYHNSLFKKRDSGRKVAYTHFDARKNFYFGLID